jgi:hypothetical protein
MNNHAVPHGVGAKLPIGLFILLTETIFLTFLGSAGIEFVLSSLIVTIALLLQLRFGIRSDSPAPADIVVFIFNWLFLDLAPKIQLLSMPSRLVNTSPVSVDNVAMTNFACGLFIVTFTFCYAFIGRRAPAPAAVAAAPSGGDDSASPREPLSAFGVALAVLSCVVVVAAAAPAAYASVDAPTTSPAVLVMKRFLLFLPSATLLILVNETVGSGRKLLFSRVCVLLLLLVLVLITENPYTEKRNALGPLYLCLILTALQHWLGSQNRRMILLVAGMVLVFPAISVFTHNHHQSLSGIEWSEFGNRIEQYYFSINYDAWANIYTAVEIVKAHGVQWGHQLAGSLLFFVPSSLWTSKPLATGIYLANYLISHYSMWFTNLSAPLVAEGYLDFGLVGVVLYGAATAGMVVLFNGVARRAANWMSLPMALYASLFLMFLLRGSLMVALGFASATFLSFWFAFALLSVGRRVRVPGPTTYGLPAGSMPAVPVPGIHGRSMVR